MPLPLAGLDRDARFARAALAFVFVLLASQAEIAAAGTIAGGTDHSVATKDDGTAWGWGDNAKGQLGDGSTTQRLTPVQVTGFPGGTLVGGVSAGQYFTVAVDQDGSVFTWGDNVAGQLGDGLTSTTRTQPYEVPGLTNATMVTAGQQLAVALKSDGTVWAWGANGDGQLGDGTTTQRNSPIQVEDTSGSGYLTGIIYISAGKAHALAVKSDGTVYAWGRNASGQIGMNSTTTPQTQAVQVLGVGGSGTLGTVAAVAGGGEHSIALKTDGTVFAWGDNPNGQLGDATTTQRLVPVQVVGVGGSGYLTSVTLISAGDKHCLVAKTDGFAWAWGKNSNGQIGIDNTTTPQKTPKQVKDSAGTGVFSGAAAVGAGLSHSVAVKDASPGTAWGWGLNSSGQVGDNTTTQRQKPKQVSGTNFTWMAAAPTFNPVAGNYETTQGVAITSTTQNATIRYTQGSDPAEPMPTDTTLGGGQTVSVTASTTLRGKAWSSTLAPSLPATAAYSLKVSTPTISPGTNTYTSAQSVTISSATNGASIYYTSDGSEPTQGSTPYTSAISVSTYTVLKAKGFKSGWVDSDTGAATYTFNYGTLSAPTLVPATGTYVSSANVTMTSVPGATIRYTVDGSDPDTSSTLYAGSVLVDITLTLKAKAWHSDWLPSGTATETYTIQVATPTFSPNGGTFSIAQNVAVASATPDAEIRYTTNGVDPTPSDSLVVGTLLIGQTTILKAQAFKTGLTPSAVKTASFVFMNSVLEGGGNHTVVVKGDATSWAWGTDGNGQLGDGDGITTARTLPNQVVAPNPPGTGYLTNVKAVAAGFSHSLALSTSGTLYGFGYNASGQLGTGNTTATTRPTAVLNLPNVVAAAAGANHSLAITSDGNLLLALAKKRAFLTGEGLELGGEVFEVSGVRRLLEDFLDCGKEVVEGAGWRQGRT